MMTIPELTEFLGWCTLINVALLALSTLALVTMKSTVIKIHAKLFSVESQDLPMLYMKYLSGFKLLVIFFNLVPYIALRLMA